MRTQKYCVLAVVHCELCDRHMLAVLESLLQQRIWPLARFFRH